MHIYIYIGVYIGKYFILIGLGYVSRKKSQRHGLVDFGERSEIEIRKDHPFANGP